MTPLHDMRVPDGQREQLDRIIRWARERAEIEAVILTGSLARQDGSADRWSDIDVELISSDPESLLANGDWIRECGQPAVVMELDGDRHHPWPTRLVIYEHGVRVDFTIAPVDRIEAMIDQDTLPPLYARGYAVMVDKRGLCDRLPATDGKPALRQAPDQAEFTRAIEEFWFEAGHVPVYLFRGERWLAKMRACSMHAVLLRVLEWHAIVTGDQHADVWHNGRAMAEWLDPSHYHALDACFGRFDGADATRAFEATIALFTRVTREIADAAGLGYAERCERSVRRSIDEALAQLRSA